METSDIPGELPAVYLVMKLSIDNFTEQDPTREQLEALGRELAGLWTGQMMTKKAIVSYRSALMGVSIPKKD